MVGPRLAIRSPAGNAASALFEARLHRSHRVRAREHEPLVAVEVAQRLVERARVLGRTDFDRRDENDVRAKLGQAALEGPRLLGTAGQEHPPSGQRPVRIVHRPRSEAAPRLRKSAASACPKATASGPDLSPLIMPLPSGRATKASEPQARGVGLRVGAERHVAAAAEPGQERALGRDGRRRLRVVERRHRLRERPVLFPALERDGPLAGRGHEQERVEGLRDLGRAARAG